MWRGEDSEAEMEASSGAALALALAEAEESHWSRCNSDIIQRLITMPVDAGVHWKTIISYLCHGDLSTQYMDNSNREPRFMREPNWTPD